MSGFWPTFRVVVIGVSLSLVMYLLWWRDDLDSRLRFVLIAAMALYAVRLYLAATELRRRKRLEQLERDQQAD